MSKKIFGVIVLILIIIIGFYLYSRKELNEDDLSTSVRIPIETTINLDEVRKFGNNSPVIIESDSSDDRASFESTGVQTRNPGSTLYINQEPLGDVEGIGVVDGYFSPTNGHFTVRTVSICGADCLDTTVYLADITNSELFPIKIPRSKNEYRGDSSQYTNIRPHIYSFAWKENTLQIEFFFLGIEKTTGKQYRLSPIEVWNYSPSDQRYILVEVLPE